MLNPFAKVETNLGRAGWIILLGVLISCVLGILLTSFGRDSDLAFLLGLAAFPFAAWFMAQAALHQGRSGLLFGVASLLPPFAILAFITLYGRDTEIRHSRRLGGDA